MIVSVYTGKARIRVQISAAHSIEEIERCVEAFIDVGKKKGVIWFVCVCVCVCVINSVAWLKIVNSVKICIILYVNNLRIKHNGIKVLKVLLRY